MSQAYVSGTIHRNIVFVDDLSLGVQCNEIGCQCV